MSKHSGPRFPSLRGVSRVNAGAARRVNGGHSVNAGVAGACLSPFRCLLELQQVVQPHPRQLFFLSLSSGASLGTGSSEGFPRGSGSACETFSTRDVETSEKAELVDSQWLESRRRAARSEILSRD